MARGGWWTSGWPARSAGRLAGRLVGGLAGWLVGVPSVGGVRAPAEQPAACFQTPPEPQYLCMYSPAPTVRPREYSWLRDSGAVRARNIPSESYPIRSDPFVRSCAVPSVEATPLVLAYVTVVFYPPSRLPSANPYGRRDERPQRLVLVTLCDTLTCICMLDSFSPSLPFLFFSSLSGSASFPPLHAR